MQGEGRGPHHPWTKAPVMAGVCGSSRVVGHLQTLTLFLSLPSSFPPFHPSLFQWRGRSNRDNGLLLPPLSSQQWRCILNSGAQRANGAPLDASTLSPPFTHLLPTIASLSLFPFQSKQTVIFPSLNTTAAFEPSKNDSKSSFPPPSSFPAPPSLPDSSLCLSGGDHGPLLQLALQVDL